MPRGRIRTMVLLLAVGACQREFLIEPQQLVATSSTIVAAADGSAVYAVSVDEGTVSRLGTEDGTLSYAGIGAEPTRITRGLDGLYVTLRGQREVVRLEDRAVGGLEVVERVTVGAEPYGIVASQDTGVVYVAVSLEDRVLELDSVTLEVLRDWHVPDEPRWLALDPLGRSLFVSSFRNARLSHIDLTTDVVRPLEIPRAERGIHGHQDGGSTETESDGGSDESADDDDWLTVALSGDPCIDPYGHRLIVPAMYLDNVALVSEDGGDEEGGSGYASDGIEVGRMNPSLLIYDIAGGEPDGPGQLVFSPADDDGVKRSRLTSAACVDERYVLATMEASDTVVVLDTSGYTRAAVDYADPRGEVEAYWLGFGLLPITEIATRRGPSGLAFANGELYIHTWLDRTISKAPWDDAVEINDLAARDSKLGFYPRIGTRQPVELIASALPPEVLEGRDLFTSALHPDMTSRSGGVSCSTCHVDGREDGITWPFAGGGRQTPSLAGRAETGPFTWNGNVASIGDEALLTTTIRMGGDGPDPYELELIETYVATLRAPDTVNSLRNDALVTRGRDLFASAGCAVCHAGALSTDGLNHLVHGPMSTNTPSLVGIAASAPYLHDGSLHTLREVLELETMADTSALAQGDLEALEAYLQSL